MINQTYPQSERHKDPLAQLRGARNRAAGNYFEGMIKAACEMYLRKAVADISKSEEPMKQITAPDVRGHFTAVYTQQAEPDFKGTLAPEGKTVVFDAKHTDGDRIEYSRLTQKQRDVLEHYHEFGAISFVLVSFSFQRFYRIPWPYFRDMFDYTGRKHLKEGDLLKKGLAVQGAGNIVYFLDKI